MSTEAQYVIIFPRSRSILIWVLIWRWSNLLHLSLLPETSQGQRPPFLSKLQRVSIFGSSANIWWTEITNSKWNFFFLAGVGQWDEMQILCGLVDCQPYKWPRMILSPPARGGTWSFQVRDSVLGLSLCLSEHRLQFQPNCRLVYSVLREKKVNNSLFTSQD